MNTCTPLYLLSGPTASGKTTLAHLLAARMNLRLLSVDSMMVYRGMDIGTAKPTPEEITRYDYAGVNLANPGETFSTGKWLRSICNQLDERPTLAVGGTGLYFRALIDGLPPESTADREAPALSVEEMQQRIQKLDSEALTQLADPHNPRRLERALDWLESGRPLPRSWQERASFPVPVLQRPVEELNHRIHLRVEEMFTQGLLKETQALIANQKLTGTAAQAIGYQEAAAVLSGNCSQKEAVEQIATRTRRYAKRQRTWFRNQMDSRWIELENGADPEFIADKIASVWQKTGAYLFDRSSYV